MGLPIYMDYHATTPVDPGVLEAMLPFFKENFGNPASRNHPFGWHAEGAVEASREQVAGLFGARGKEIVFSPTEGRRHCDRGRELAGQDNLPLLLTRQVGLG